MNNNPLSAHELGRRREELAATARQHGVETVPAQTTALMDRYFRDRLSEILQRNAGLREVPFSLVAVGGYGRSELCPASDVDVLLLFRRQIPDAATELSAGLFHPLWDLGLDLGHGVRNIKDCLSLAREDFQVLSSLLDVRHVAGDPAVTRRFRGSFPRVARSRSRAFAAWVAERNVDREARYGDSSALLEPNLKNGLGALRDAHQIGWCSVLLEVQGKWVNPLSREERQGLINDAAFVLQARTALHLATGRRTDTLFFDLQPQVSDLRGFSHPEQEPFERALGVERFLSDLHRCMGRIKTLRQAFFRECFPPRFRRVRHVSLSSATELVEAPQGLRLEQAEGHVPDPRAGMALFVHAARTGQPLALETLRMVRGHAPDWAAALADRPETLQSLLDLFRLPHGGEASAMMLETGFLAALIPEFGEVQDLVQFDDYHVHPVGPHTLATMENLGTLLAGGEDYPASLARELARPDLLLLAGLFHDLGKGHQGHSVKGAEIARTVLERYGLPASDVEQVAFLVRHHLLLPKTAMRKDLSDEAVVGQVAGIAGTMERLVMLHLLSMADSMATGPRAWSSWTETLFSELFLKARNLLSHGPLSAPASTAQLLEAKEAVRSIAERFLPESFVARHLEAVSPRAFQALAPEALARHLELMHRFAEAPDRHVFLEARRADVPDAFEVTVASKNRPGRFARLTGCLTMHRLDILSADVFTWGRGMVVDVFRVSPPKDRLFPDSTWERLVQTMRGALSGEISPARELEQMRRSPLHQPRSAPPLPPDIKLDDEASDFYTIIEVAAPDRLGLLHDIACVLERLGIEVHLAKITTKSGRIADIFYVRGTHGMRINGPEQETALKDGLLPVLS